MVVLRGRPATVLLLILWAALLGYAVYFVSAPIAQADRAGREARNYLLLAAGVLGLVGGIVARRTEPKTVVDALAVLLPCYAALQLVPLPLFLLRVLSPERARLAGALAPLSLEHGSAPLSVATGLTLVHVLLLVGYAVVFVSLREIARAGRDSPRLAVLPILAIASWQAVWGLTNPGV